jgi:hypothetical protein
LSDRPIALRDPIALELTVSKAPAKSQDIRRHPDGSIDIDFYRTRAAALRGQAKRDGVMLKMASAVVLTVAGGLALAMLVAAPEQHAPAERRLAQLSVQHQGSWHVLGLERSAIARAHATWEARP